MKILAVKCFAVLVLDFEYPAEGKLPAMCGGRVLIDGVFDRFISADSVDNLILKFFE